MDKHELKSRLSNNHSLFIIYIGNLNKGDFLESKNHKWAAGQQLEHIYISVKTLRHILSLPKFLLKLIWGKANRQSRTNEELVNKYLSKLENGGKATSRFIPKIVEEEKRQKLIQQLNKEVTILCTKLDKYKEEELDSYTLPHPLLGRITLREMLYFTIHHVIHHLEIAKRNLKQ